MKTIPTELLAPAFKQVLAQLAAKHDLPELLTAPVITESNLEARLFRASAFSSPRGQMSAFVKELEVEITLDCWDDSATTFGVRIHYNYKHVGSGSNGDNVDLILVVQQRFGRDSVAEVVALVERNEYLAIRSALKNNA